MAKKGQKTKKRRPERPSLFVFAPDGQGGYLDACCLQRGIQRRARTHDRLGLLRIGLVVAADIDRLALNHLQFSDDLSLVGGQGLGQLGEAGGQFLVLGGYGAIPGLPSIAVTSRRGLSRSA